MKRTTFNALAVLALAAVTIVGCGKEDISDIRNDWTKMENDLQQKLTEVKNDHAELMSKITAMPVANTTDSTAAAERTTVEQTLSQHEKDLGEVETMIASSSAKREEAEKSGARTDYEAAWNASKADYEGAMAKLDELERQNSDLESKVDGWNNKVVNHDTTVHAAPTTTTTTTTHDTIVKK